MSVNFEISLWCLQFLPKNEWNQVDLRYHSSTVKFVRSFFLDEPSAWKNYFNFGWPLVRENCNIFRVHMWFHAQLAQKYWMVSIAHKMRWTNQLVTLENQGPTVFWRLNRGSTWEFLPVCHKALLEPCYWPVYLKVKIFTIGALYTPQRLG